MDTNTLISICTFAILLTQFLFWRYIAKNKSYESEKGKNIATKEDISEITKEIEVVKNQISYEKQRENEFLFERKNKLISFIPAGIIHKNLILKVLYCYNRLNDPQYIRDLYNEIHAERLKAETIYYECISYNSNEFVLDKIGDYIKVIGEISGILIKAIHDLELYASNRLIYLNSKQKAENIKDKIEEIDNMIKSSFEDYDKKHNDIASKISKAIADYSVFIEVLNENNYHQKINPTEMRPTKSPAI